MECHLHSFFYRLFRHLLYEYFLRVFSVSFSFFAISVLFVFVHFDSNFIFNFQYFLVSFSLLMLRHISNNFWLCFLSHLISNLVVIFILGG
ncbi:CPBP family intramembrane glutamic endopeptidase [Rheinheimera baltica]|uniref:CPBP family intramembrane glutamic endopeptidase n=1 Tax=Rheinheimera baltica TaxID=67576 RepID=UPI003B8A613D